MARRQSHLVNQTDVPRANNQTTAVGIGFNLPDDVGNLVDMPTIGRGSTAPLNTVNRTQIAVFIGPFVPNRDLIVMQVLDVARAR